MPVRSSLWAVPPLALGIALAGWLVSQAQGPAQVPGQAPRLAVRVITVAPQDIRPVARGWGNVRAADTWTAVAEVRGQVIWRHPELEPGRMVAAGTRLLEIDPEDYRLAIAQAEADLAGLAAEAAQITAEAGNTERIRTLEAARLALAEAELARMRDLVAQGTAPPARADEVERATLSARRTVLELDNALALIPARQDRLTAQVARTEAALARARRDLAHTVVTAPRDLRLTAVQVAERQAVAVGQPLVSGDGVAQVEVVVQVPVSRFRHLIAGLSVPDAGPAFRFSVPEAPLAAELRLIGAPEQRWTGRVTRVEAALDPRARTVPVVVTIDDPYAGTAPPLRLPLVPNMPVEVTLTGPALAAQVVIPEAALHGGLVYLAGPDDRLVLRPVTPLFRQDGLVVIAAGLEPGARLVLDDIAPALPGLALLPVEGTGTQGTGTEGARSVDARTEGVP